MTSTVESWITCTIAFSRHSYGPKNTPKSTGHFFASGPHSRLPCRPDLQELYKTVWEIKQKIVLDMAADRGPYIDQSQSLYLGSMVDKIGLTHEVAVALAFLDIW